MSQVFVDLPVPSANGSGTPVDVSSFGPLKSIAVAGGASCITVVEMSNDPGALFWAPVWVFPVGGGEKNFNLACHWMRATIQQFRSGTPAVSVGGTNEGAVLVQIDVPAGNGAGAAFDVSLLGLFKTLQIGGSFTGSMQFEVSEDGVTNWSTVFSFQNPGVQSSTFAAHHARIRRNGVLAANPGTPVAYLGTSDALSGDRGVAISAGSQSVGTGTVVFADSNGVTFGMSGSTQVTASVAAIKSISALGSAASGPTIVFVNTNNVTFGISGNTITASVQTAGGTATGVAISAGSQVATTGAVVFSNSNGVSFGLNAQTLTASVAPTIALSAGTVAQSMGTIVFSNSNSVSFGMSGSTVTASAYQPPIQRVVGFTATGGETQFTVTFTPAVVATNYSVWGQNNGVSQIQGLDIPAGSASRSVSAFAVVPTNALASGDQFAFFMFAST